MREKRSRRRRRGEETGSIKHSEVDVMAANGAVQHLPLCSAAELSQPETLEDVERTGAV